LVASNNCRSGLAVLLCATPKEVSKSRQIVAKKAILEKLPMVHL
jgi:hypothetical protein